jgi:hypothetical protein
MMVQPHVVFGREPWATAEMDIKGLDKWERKIFRRIYGPVV